MKSERSEIDFILKYYEFFALINDNINDFIDACRPMIESGQISQKGLQGK